MKSSIIRWLAIAIAFAAIGGCGSMNRDNAANGASSSIEDAKGHTSAL